MGGRLIRCAKVVLCTLFATASAGCYHYTFEFRRPPLSAGLAPVPGVAAYDPNVIVYTERVHTWVNGFVGNGRLDVRMFCRNPIRAELKVTATDVLISAATLLIYTPHTLTVTCPAPPLSHDLGTIKPRPSRRD
jgi:hypothetical protein